MSFLKKAIGLIAGVVGAVIGFVVAGPAGAAIGFSIGMGIGAAAQLAAMKTKVPSTSSATGDRLNVSIDPDAFRAIAFGETALGTDQRYWESFGPENSHFDQVIAAAGHEIESFGKLFLDDEEVTFSGDNATGAYAGALSKQDRIVGVTATALTVGAGSLWTSAASMTGVAHYALKIQWSQAKYPRGIPSRITRVGRGAKVYDPRRDSTQPGGSGSHRANNQSTWAYSPTDSNGVAIGRNPALQVLWYEIGWRVTNPDTSEAILVCGRGRPLDDIDFASFMTGANDCETEEYYSDVLLSTGDAHETNIAVLEAACAGKLMDTGGRIGLRIRNDTTGDIVQAFTDGDVLDTDASVWRPRLPLSERWNQGIGSIVDPRALYKVVPFPVVRDAAYEAEDGFKRPGPAFRYDAVQDGDQAQRLVRLELNISRYQGVFTAPFNWRAKKVRIWDCVTLTFPRLGFADKIFRVLEKKTDPMGAIWLLLREDDPSIYDSGAVNPVPPPLAGAGYDARVVTAPSAGAWAVTSVYVEGGGARLPGLLIVGSALPPNIVAVQISYRQTASSDWTLLGRFNAVPVIRTGVPGVAPNTSHHIRLVYENAYGVSSSPTDVGPFTSLAEFNALTAETADLIVGQGWGATASQFAVDNQYPFLRMGQGPYRNANFAEPFASSAVPPGWSSWVNGAGTFSPLPGASGSGFALAGGAAANGGVIQAGGTAIAGSFYLLEAEAQISSGDVTGAGAYVSWRDSSNVEIANERIVFATAADSSGVTSASKAGMRRWERRILAPAGTVGANIFAMSHFDGFGSIAAANALFWRLANLRPLTLVAELGANVTALNTAAGIAGQGWGATASQFAVDNQYPFLRMGQGPYRNANFAEPFASSAVPPGWSNWVAGAGTFSPLPGASGSGFLLAGAATANGGVIQSGGTAIAASFYLLEAEAQISSGDVTGAGAYVSWRDSSNVEIANERIVFATEADSSGVTSASKAGMRRWEKRILAPAGTVGANIFAMSHFSGFGSIAAANALFWRLTNLRPLTLVAELGANVTALNTAAGITGQGLFALGNFFEQASDPGSVANGSFWSKTGSRELLIRSAGSWKKVANIGLDLSISLAPAVYVGPTPSCTATGAGGSGGYTYAWTRVSGVTLTVTSPSSAATNFTGGISGDSAVYRCTVTDSIAATVYQDLGIAIVI